MFRSWGTHHLRVLIEVIIHLLGTTAKSVGLAIAVDALLGSVDLACLCNVYKSIYIHLSVHTEIFQIGFCNHGADCVGHAADTELETCAIGDLVYDQLGNSLIYIGRGTACAEFTDRGILALNDIVYVADMYVVLETTETTGHIFIYFDNDGLCHLACSSQMGGIRTKIEITVIIHRCADYHYDI